MGEKNVKRDGEVGRGGSEMEGGELEEREKGRNDGWRGGGGGRRGYTSV